MGVGLIERVLPAQLGRNFRWLFGSATLANLGDGVLLAAGPLLVASLTRDPLAVALAIFAQRLPWLLFSVLAGALIDRVDRRRLVMLTDGLRVVVVGGLALVVATDQVTLPILYAAMFLIGTAETFADNAYQALTVAAVSKRDLGRANSRLFGSAMITNQMAGPPLGALLFGLGAWLPLGFNAVCFALGVVLISRMRLPRRVREEGVPGSLRRETAEGLRWLWAHPPVRTLAVMITGFNITFGAAFAVWVLYAQDRLGLGEIGFGLLLTASALGGVLGSVLYGRLERRFSLASLLRAGLVLETLVHAALALTTHAVVAGLVVLAFGVHAVVWGTTSTTVRQRAVPDALIGRVTSVYLLGSLGAISLGTLLGGWLASQWGILAPFWFAFAGSAVLTVLLWRSISNVAHAAELPEDELPEDELPEDEQQPEESIDPSPRPW